MLYWDFGIVCLKCDSFWVNIFGEGGYYSGYIYFNSVILGICYIVMFVGVGWIKFEDLCLLMMMVVLRFKLDVFEVVI